MKPEILLVGQITIDDTVPAEPGPWQQLLGGNALYALAGARLWCEAGNLGMVARVPAGLPFDIFGILEEAGMSTEGLTHSDTEPLVEWILYEQDGNRQSMPRNAFLRDPGADAATLYHRYLDHIERISASAEDFPSSWLPAGGVHLAPQVSARHIASCRFLEHRTGFLSVDPSPHYARGASPQQLSALLPHVNAFLPSQAEVEHLFAADESWGRVLKQLCQSGFPEVVLKRGSLGCLLAQTAAPEIRAIPAAAAQPLDLTGAGDAFSGAYLANRVLGHAASEAARRAAVTAAMVIECSGAVAALRLLPEDANRRLAAYGEPPAVPPFIDSGT